MRNNFFLLFCALLNISLFLPTNPSYSFVPSVYEPSKKTLIDTSIGIGRTASKYIQYGQAKEAINLAKLALSLNPKEANLWIILARAQLYSNLLSDSLISIKNAQEIDSKSPIVWFTKASIEMQIGDIEAAIQSIRKNIKLEKNNSNSYFLLGNAKLMQKKYSNSLEAFKKATDINPNFGKL